MRSPKEKIGRGLIIIGVSLSAFTLIFAGVLNLPSILLILLGAIFISQGRNQKAAPTTEELEQRVGRTGPSKGKQVVGELCATCDKSIMVDAEGTLCATCEAPLHLRCEAEHKSVAHPLPPGPPYR